MTDIMWKKKNQMKLLIKLHPQTPTNYCLPLRILRHHPNRCRQRSKFSRRLWESLQKKPLYQKREKRPDWHLIQTVNQKKGNQFSNFKAETRKFARKTKQRRYVTKHPDDQWQRPRATAASSKTTCRHLPREAADFHLIQTFVWLSKQMKEPTTGTFRMLWTI